MQAYIHIVFIGTEKQRGKRYLSTCVEEYVIRGTVNRDDAMNKKQKFIIPPPTLRELTKSKQEEDMVTAEQDYKRAEKESKSDKSANKNQKEKRIFSFE